MQNLTRRNFVKRVGQAGGVGAAFLAMQGLGLTPAAAETGTASVVGLKPTAGKGTKVVILGAGMAGLAAAYELKKGGYEVTVLEARDRPTGRAWTIHSGDKVELLDGDQHCDWEPGHYLNPGPARIPSHHQTILSYIKELNVPIEVEVNSSRSAFLYNKDANDGKPMMMRRVINDTRGYVSELLAKAVNQGALDKEITGIDKEKMVSFLRQYGDLSPDLFYKGSTRSGYKSYPGAADEVGEMNDPLTLKSLLDEDMWGAVLTEDSFTQQATMFQPVGGINQTGVAIAKALGPSVKLMAEVKELRKTPKGVRIVYLDRKTGKTNEVTADYCISTIAVHLLARIPNDLSKDIQEGISQVTGGGEGVKIGFESRRFWEQDYNVYGGLSSFKSKTARATLWTPSGGYHTKTGITVYYGSVEPNMERPAQFELARSAWEGAFPGHGKELTKPIGVQWSKVPYNEGAGAHFSDNTKWLYERLNQNDGPVYFAADYLSHVSGWQEGAIRSGHHAVRLLDERVQATKPA